MSWFRTTRIKGQQKYYRHPETRVITPIQPKIVTDTTQKQSVFNKTQSSK